MSFQEIQILGPVFTLVARENFHIVASLWLRLPSYPGKIHVLEVALGFFLPLRLFSYQFLVGLGVTSFGMLHQ